MKWRCKVCNWIYDEEKEGIKFKDLPEDWKCPVCGVKKSMFEKVMAGERKNTVADKIIEQLAAVGVKYIYGIPGDTNLPLIEALRNQNKIKFVLTRHEETAAFMASAYGKLTGELGVCVSIAGPGTTNLLTGLMDAATDGSPVLALTGQISQMRLGSEGFQEINQIELFRSFAVFTETITSPAQAVRLTMMAVKRAYSRRGVAHLSLPTDVLMKPLNERIWNPEEHIFKHDPEPSEKDIRMAAKLINRSKKPMMLGGWGIRKAGREVIALAEKSSSPIATTSRAKGTIPEDHRLAVGVLGAIGTPYAAKAAKNADLLIVLGAAFRQRNLVPEVPIIQVDINGFRIGREFPVTVGIIGDAALVMRKLVRAVKKKTQDKGYFRKIREIRTAHRKEIESDAKNTSVPIYPGYVIQAIKKHADKNALICVDVGDHTYWFYRKYVCKGEETLISANLASMAFALPASLSGQLIYPGRQVICITGDGGFAMLMADFTTAVFNKLPVKVIVFNDGKLKNIKKEQEMFGYAEFGTEFVNPNFAEFAKSCGGEGYRVEKPEELDSALKKAFKSKGPAIIDVVVDPNKMTPITLAAPQG